MIGQISLDEIDSETLKIDTQYADRCLGQVVQALIEVNKEEIASKLLGCKMRWQYVDDGYDCYRGIYVLISGTVSIIEELLWHGDSKWGEERKINESRKLLEHYTDLVLGHKFGVREWNFQVEMPPLASNWREELLDVVRKNGTTNQGVTRDNSNSIVQYANLNFRSQSEIKIAKALDNAGLMYFANCTGRVNKGQDRVNREPDFLVCHSGKWGILEVDGEPFHPPTRTVHDHERDTLFQKHGVIVVKHYDASRCYQEPTQVVTEFLDLLAHNG